MAADRGLTVEEINFTAEKQKKIRREVDELLDRIGREKDSFVIDSRIAFHWIPKSFKVFLDLDPRRAAERTFAHIQKNGRVSQTAVSVEEVQANTRRRIESEQKRYRSLYNLDFMDKSQFDLVVDTAANNLEQVIRHVITEYQKWLNASDHG